MDAFPVPLATLREAEEKRCSKPLAGGYSDALEWRNRVAVPEPYVFCVDVGSPTNIGWADSLGASGSACNLHTALQGLGERLRRGEPVALGFEAPIWTPRRVDICQITSARGGVEREQRRAWSAGAGCGALGAGLGLMPWCFAMVHTISGPVPATTNPDRFRTGEAPLFVWEAFVTAKAKGLTHHEDAAVAVAAFWSHWPELRSDVPGEPAMNHAASALRVSGFTIAEDELGTAPIVIAPAPREVR